MRQKKISEEITAENSYKLVQDINQYSRSSYSSDAKQDKYKEKRVFIYHGQTVENQT